MYKEGISAVAREIKIKNSSVLVTGATGLIGSCIIDVLGVANNELGANITIFALGRSKERLQKRFGDLVIPIEQDIICPLDENAEYDYIIHAASNADPKTYAIQPVETIITNILGNKMVYDYCVKYSKTRVLLTSSFEVYGEIPGNKVYLENMSGYIDQMPLRNGYPESKRCCELLLRSYVEEYGVNASIARLPSVYGPTMQKTDSKAHAQFIKSALRGDDIILKSKGEQRRSYCYVIDVVSALFSILLNGANGEIYNIANEKSVASIAEVARVCAEFAGTHVRYELPDEIEAKGFSKPHDCVLDNTKLCELGWRGKYSLQDGIEETLEYLRSNDLC